MSEKSDRIAKLKKMIDLSEKTLKNPPDSMKAMLPTIEEKLKKAKAELEELEKEEKPEPKTEAKPAPKAEPKPAAEKKQKAAKSARKSAPKKAAKKTGKKSVKKVVKTAVKKSATPRKKKEPAAKLPKVFVFEGKEIKQGDIDYCKNLIDAVGKRLKKRKESGKKFSTKSVMRRVTDNVGHAVDTAISNTSAKEIAANPKRFISKVKTLRTKFREFMAAFESVLGKDFKKGEIDKQMKELDAVITKLEKKYTK